ncbi:MAG TPA: MlaD family protein [Holophagaceae bacterium]
MNFEKQDVRLGLFVLVALGLFLGLLVFKNARAVVQKTYPLRVRLDSMEGLAPGSEVDLKGYPIGSVDQIEMRQEGVEYHFLATLSIRADIRLWKGTRALVASKGLGSGFLDLQLPDPAERKVVLAPGDQIPGDQGVSIGGVLDKADRLLDTLNGSVEELRDRIRTHGLGDVLDHPSVKQALQALNTTLQEFQALAKEGRGLVGHADRSMGEADKAIADLDASLAVTRGLLETRKPELDRIVVSLASTLQQADALLSQFRAEDQPELEASLKTLRRSLDSVEELLQILKQKPSRVVWGTPSEAERARARKAVEDAKRAPAPKE